MRAWLKRFGLHLVAAVGATGVFVAAAAVGASQTHQQEASVSTPAAELRTRTPPARPKPTVVAATPTPGAKVNPERSLAGSVKELQADGIDVLGGGGRNWHVVPAPGALIRLNGKATPLEGLQAGDSVVILGQAQPGRPGQFLAHAITARRK